MTRHLDLGCGDNPRNPYLMEHVYGVDVVEFKDVALGSRTKLFKADLFGPLPFESDFFDSVSAFDFIEHLPRSHFCETRHSTVNPFVDLMSEAWRILRDGGLFLASTPAFPHKKSFQDPTHVNIITEDTHTYFLGPDPYARRYGFKGHFQEVFVGWDAQKNAWLPLQSDFRKRFRNFEHAFLKGGRSHITWVFRAIKNP